jgi:broad specificity phosphatase PhoE
MLGFPRQGTDTLRCGFALVALLLALAGCVTADERQPQPNIYVMRHLHTPEGARDPDLTPEGRRHALMLVDWFRRDLPDAIYARDTAGLVAALLKEEGTILVIGHSNTVPDIVAALGGKRPEPLVHEDFADIWRVAGPDRVTTQAKLSD